MTHVQDLSLVLVELHEVHTGPVLKLVKAPLDGFPSHWLIEYHTAWCDGKLAGDTLDVIVPVSDKGV